MNRYERLLESVKPTKKEIDSVKRITESTEEKTERLKLAEAHASSIKSISNLIATAKAAVAMKANDIAEVFHNEAKMQLSEAIIRRIESKGFKVNLVEGVLPSHVFYIIGEYSMTPVGFTREQMERIFKQTIGEAKSEGDFLKRVTDKITQWKEDLAPEDQAKIRDWYQNAVHANVNRAEMVNEFASNKQTYGEYIREDESGFAEQLPGGVEKEVQAMAKAIFAKVNQVGDKYTQAGVSTDDNIYGMILRRLIELLQNEA